MIGVDTSIECDLQSSSKLEMLSSSAHVHQLPSPLFKSGKGPNCFVSSSVTSIRRYGGAKEMTVSFTVTVEEPFTSMQTPTCNKCIH